jgi:hypothetical protein
VSEFEPNPFKRDELAERNAFWSYVTVFVCGAGFWVAVGLAYARSRGWL